MKATALIRMLVFAAPFAALASAAAASLAEQNEALFRELQAVHGLSDEQMGRIRAIFRRSGFIGQGNPAVSEHPDTPGQCRAKLESQSVSYANPNFEKICRAMETNDCSKDRR